MARDRRRPTNRHVRRPARAPLRREPQAPDIAIDRETVEMAMEGGSGEATTWLAMLLLISSETTRVLEMVQRMSPEDGEQAATFAWTGAEDSPSVLSELREAALDLLALRLSLERVTEATGPGDV